MLPRGRKLVTLEDAGNYITRLPKAEHEAPEWQAAMEALILVATYSGPTMCARIGIMRALNRHVIRGLGAHYSRIGLRHSTASPTASPSSAATNVMVDSSGTDMLE